MNWILAASLIGSLLAQLSLPAHNETMEVVVANVDVTVVAKDGTHVSGLLPDDFEILDNGVPQRITNFSEIQESRTITPQLTAAGTPAEATASQPHRIVFLIDNLSLHPDARKHVFASARRFLHSSLGPNDEAMIVTCANGLKLRLPFTNDRDDIEASLSDIEHDVALGGLRIREVSELREELLSMESAPLATGVARQYAMRTRQEVQHTTDVMKTVLAWMSGIPGKKALVFMTESLPAEPGIEAFRFIQTKTRGLAYTNAAEEFYAHDLIDSVTAAANAASTTLYPIYARGLSSIGNSLNTRNPNPVYGSYQPGISDRLVHQGMQPTLADAMMIDRDAFETTKGALDVLAISTGGFASTGGENFDRIFTDIASDLGSYYSIGYRPTMSGTKHKLVVRMKNPQWTARAREEVMNKSDRDRAIDLVTGALFEQTARNDLGISLHFGTKTVDKKKKAHLPLSIRIPIAKLVLVENTVKFDIHLRVADQTGGLSQTADATREIKVPAAELAAARGKYYTFQVDLVADELKLRVAAAVTDVQGATTSVAVQEVDLRQ
jgi:VWFA-related protein